MTVTFDRSVASSIMEAGYNYTPTGNSTIAVDFDSDRDIYDALADAGLDHLADSVIYTNYYEVNWEWNLSSLQIRASQTMQRMWRNQTPQRLSII